MDRDLQTKIDTGIQIGARIADALEKLVNEPLLEVETPPAQCPHCGKVFPDIQIEQSNAEGNIKEFVLEATCLSCGRPLYGLVTAWNLQGSRSAAIAAGQVALERKNNG